MAERWRNRARRFQVRIEYVGVFGAASCRRPWAAHLDRHMHTRPEPADDRHQAVHREAAQVSVADAREIGRRYPGSDLRRTNRQTFTVERLNNLAGQNRLELDHVDLALRSLDASHRFLLKRVDYPDLLGNLLALDHPERIAPKRQCEL